MVDSLLRQRSILTLGTTLPQLSTALVAAQAQAMPGRVRGRVLASSSPAAHRLRALELLALKSQHALILVQSRQVGARGVEGGEVVVGEGLHGRWDWVGGWVGGWGCEFNNMQTVQSAKRKSDCEVCGGKLDQISVNEQPKPDQSSRRQVGSAASPHACFTAKHACTTG